MKQTVLPETIDNPTIPQWNLGPHKASPSDHVAGELFDLPL